MSRPIIKNKNKKSNDKPIYKINSIHDSSKINSILIKLDNTKYRALLDSGAETSCLHRKVYDSLKSKPKLLPATASLQAVSGDMIPVDGTAVISLRIGKETVNHKFHILPQMTRNVILGEDFFNQNGVRLYFDLKCMRLGKSLIPMQKDIHIASLVRISSKTVLKPQSYNICMVKIRARRGTYQISGSVNSALSDEPGVMVGNTIVRVKNNSKVPVLILNNTGKFVKIKKGVVVAQIERVEECNLVSMTDSDKVPTDPVDIMTVGSARKAYVTLDQIKHKIQTAEEHRPLTESILGKNIDLIAEKDEHLGCTKTVEASIDTGDHPPIRRKPYRTPMHKRPVVDKAIDDMLSANVIRYSRSPWAFPIVIVGKKDGTTRFCSDYRFLNGITKKNSWPLPVIDDILSMLKGTQYISTLDLKSGFWQIPIKESDKQKTAFTCHRGLFEYNKLPFGLCNAPSIFQECMSKVLNGLQTFAIPYLDDILVFSKSLEDHKSHLQQVFDRLREHDLKIKISKCNFFQEETQYLGFIINRDGVKPDPEKVKVIKEMVPPTNAREVRGFIGMCSYYRRFIPNFSGIASPIVNLSRKYVRFKWSDECQAAFDCLKESLGSAPVLSYPDINRPFILYTDASDLAIGSVLCQSHASSEEDLDDPSFEKPVYFLSHKLTDTQQRWSVIQKEAYAIVFSLQKLDHYLHDSNFVIRTDHKPLKYLLESPMENKTIQKWALAIAGYSCSIEYIPGKENCVADCLSRLPNSSTIKPEDDIDPIVSDKAYTIDMSSSIKEVSVIDTSNIDPKSLYSQASDPIRLIDFADLNSKDLMTFEDFDLSYEQSKDPDIVDIKNQLVSGKASKTVDSKFIYLDGIVYFVNNSVDDLQLRVYLPSHVQRSVIIQYHDNNGHLGIDKTYDCIRSKYYWPNLYKYVYDYVSRCETCQTVTMRKIKPPLQDTDIPSYPFQKVSVDLSGPYPESLSGNKYIISFVDWYSGWPEAYAVKDKTAENIVHLLLDEILPKHGTPLVLVSDNGTENINYKVRETLQTFNIHHVTTNLYHPQSNSRVERFHKTLHQILSKKIENEEFETWDVYLNQTLAAVRFHINESTRQSPFSLLYNREPMLPIDNILKPRTKYMGEDFHKIAIQEQHKSFVRVHRHLRRAKERQKRYHKGQMETFEVGDPVFLRRHVRNTKLQDKWKKYYKIYQKTGPVSFVLKNQVDGTLTKAHAEHLRRAKSEWKIPKADGRPLRRERYVEPPSSESEDETAPSNSEEDQNQNDKMSGSGSDSEDNIPLARLAERYRKERDASSDEEDIPLFELAQRLKSQKKPPLKPKETDTMEVDSVSKTSRKKHLTQLLTSMIGLL